MIDKIFNFIREYRNRQLRKKIVGLITRRYLGFNNYVDMVSDSNELYNFITNQNPKTPLER
jgi:hypothetical protein